MKKTLILAPLFALCLCVSVARAQGGDSGSGPCDSSPENPTLILAAIGSTGAGLAALRSRLRTRKQNKQ